MKDWNLAVSTLEWVLRLYWIIPRKVSAQCSMLSHCQKKIAEILRIICRGVRIKTSLGYLKKSKRNPAPQECCTWISDLFSKASWGVLWTQRGVHRTRGWFVLEGTWNGIPQGAPGGRSPNPKLNPGPGRAPWPHPSNRAQMHSGVRAPKPGLPRNSHLVWVPPRALPGDPSLLGCRISPGAALQVTSHQIWGTSKEARK